MSRTTLRILQLVMLSIGAATCIVGSHFHATTAVVLGAFTGFGAFLGTCSS